MADAAVEMEWFQQGDVMLKPVAAIPKNAKKAKNNILAYGEMTGHSHQVFGEGATIFMHTNIMYVEAPNGGEVRHNTHGPIPIPAGTYQIGIVQEYDHFNEEARPVVD